jgi:hypothetical protein
VVTDEQPQALMRLDAESTPAHGLELAGLPSAAPQAYTRLNFLTVNPLRATPGADKNAADSSARLAYPLPTTPGRRRLGVATSCSTQAQQPERTLLTPADRYNPQRQRKDLQQPRRH